MKLATKKAVAILLVAAILVGTSSCRTQQGCPNNFSLDLNE